MRNLGALISSNFLTLQTYFVNRRAQTAVYTPAGVVSTDVTN